jgi:hypothetical protein
MGGVWFPASTHLLERPDPGSAAKHLPSNAGPILWRARFDNNIADDLVLFTNPLGSITNSDLELAASLVQHDVAAHTFNIRERTVASGSDNTPTVAWQQKGSTTTTSAPAYLLRIQALHQRFHCYCLSSFFVPGLLNAMADDCSRLWRLTDAELISHFNLTYPQTGSWRLAIPKPEMLSSVTCALRRQRPAPASFLLAPAPTTARGSSGKPFATISSSTLGSPTPQTQSFSYRSLPNATEQAKLHPASGLHDLEQWNKPSARWVRPLRAWGPRTLV